MARRSGLDIKKAILEVLKDGPKAISELERKVNTSDRVIKRHVVELEYLGLVKRVTHPKSKNTGRPFTIIKLAP